MTDQEARTALLWEVWDWFDKLGKYIETEKYLNSFGKKGSDGLSHDGRNHLDDDQQFQMLRAVLLERCEKVKDTYGNYDSFSLAKDAEGRWIIDIEHRGQDREDDAETARNMAAAYLFMAWELEQRGKEAKGE